MCIYMCTCMVYRWTIYIYTYICIYAYVHVIRCACLAWRQSIVQNVFPKQFLTKWNTFPLALHFSTRIHEPVQGWPVYKIIAINPSKLTEALGTFFDLLRIFHTRARWIGMYTKSGRGVVQTLGQCRCLPLERTWLRATAFACFLGWLWALFILFDFGPKCRRSGTAPADLATERDHHSD